MEEFGQPDAAIRCERQDALAHGDGRPERSGQPAAPPFRHEWVADGQQFGEL